MTSVLARGGPVPIRSSHFGFGMQGVGLRVERSGDWVGLGFRIQGLAGLGDLSFVRREPHYNIPLGLGFRIQGLTIARQNIALVQGSGFRVQSAECKVLKKGKRVYGVKVGIQG